MANKKCFRLKLPKPPLGRWTGQIVPDGLVVSVVHHDGHCCDSEVSVLLLGAIALLGSFEVKNIHFIEIYQKVNLVFYYFKPTLISFRSPIG